MHSRRESPILLIHGLIGTLKDQRLFNALSGRTILAPDLYGYGRRQRTATCNIAIPAQVELIRQTVCRECNGSRVHLVGHSVGAVVACFFAHAWPDFVASIVSVEGNFSLKDAFWSASVAKLTDDEANKMLAEFCVDPVSWLKKSGVSGAPENVAMASRWLGKQPGSTVRRMADSVVRCTRLASYEQILREVFAMHAVHLVSGERSRGSWDIPAWAQENAASDSVLKNVGHLMMLEDAPGFSRIISRITKGRRKGRNKNLAAPRLGRITPTS